MSVALVAACLWILAASLISLLPSRDRHWRAAYGLVAIGIPILGWVTYSNGPLWGSLALVAGVSILRWPTVYLWRRIARAFE